LASQGLLREPSPEEPAGQSCTGALALALGAGAGAVGAGAADTGGGGGALLALGAAGALCSSEQAPIATAIAAVINAFEKGVALGMAGSLVALAGSRSADLSHHIASPSEGASSPHRRDHLPCSARGREEHEQGSSHSRARLERR